VKVSVERVEYLLTLVSDLLGSERLSFNSVGTLLPFLWSQSMPTTFKGRKSLLLDDVRRSISEHSSISIATDVDGNSSFLLKPRFKNNYNDQLSVW